MQFAWEEADYKLDSVSDHLAYYNNTLDWAINNKKGQLSVPEPGKSES